MTKFKILFGIDLRSLALLRVLIGSLVLVDLLLRSRFLIAHYSDSGLLPLAQVFQQLSVNRFSLYFLNGSITYQTISFITASFIALVLILGYRTRLMIVLSWLMLLSLHNRNVLLLQGGDNLLLLLLFWSMFLPLGARFSIDAALNRTNNIKNNYFSIATMALLIQCMSVYFFSAFLKTGTEWIPDGTAVYYALQIDALVKPFGVWLKQFTDLLHGLTYYVWYLELLGPILIFSPLFFLPFRLIIMIMLFTIHFGFYVTMEIGLFPFISMTTILIFTPSWVWDKLSAYLHNKKRAGLKIYYDNDCGFCKKTCLIFRSFFLLSGTPIIPAQSDEKIYAVLKEKNSWVLQDYNGDNYIRWDAITLMCKRSWLIWPFSYIINKGPMKIIGEYLYNLIATNRELPGRLFKSFLPYRDFNTSISMKYNILAGIFMVSLLYYNLTTLPQNNFKYPKPMKTVNDVLRLDQTWDMFAPFPLKTDGWHVIRGLLRNGKIVDVYNNKIGEPSFIKPRYISRLYPYNRWRKYLFRISDFDNNKYLSLYGQYICRDWNKTTKSENQLIGFHMYLNEEITLPNYQVPDIQHRLILKHWCFSQKDHKYLNEIKFPE